MEDYIKKISLFGSFGEDLRIEIYKNGNKEYYITDTEFYILKRVDKKTFLKELKNFEDMVKSSWNKQIKKEYAELLNNL